jgi:pectate lyase
VSTLIGWATQGGGTTGGGDASPTTVSGASELESALSGSSARVVQFSGTISVGELAIGPNKTLIGMGTDATIDGSIAIHDAENVIVKNVRLDASGSDGDGFSIQSSSRVWIDHCEVFDAADGNMDITDASDYITVSWTIFRYSGSGDHNFSNLIGSSDEDSGNYRITFHHNWWGANALERMPRVRFGSVHVLNNFYGTGTGANLGNDHCVRAGFEADVLVENNVFDHVATPHEIDEDNGTAIMSASGNLYLASLNLDGNPETRGTAFDPPYDYTAEPAECIKASVMEGAGPQ